METPLPPPPLNVIMKITFFCGFSIIKKIFCCFPKGVYLVYLILMHLKINRVHKYYMAKYFSTYSDKLQEKRLIFSCLATREGAKTPIIC